MRPLLTPTDLAAWKNNASERYAQRYDDGRPHGLSRFARVLAIFPALYMIPHTPFQFRLRESEHFDHLARLGLPGHQADIFAGAWRTSAIVFSIASLALPRSRRAVTRIFSAWPTQPATSCLTPLP
jgi:hypothetical protein